MGFVLGKIAFYVSLVYASMLNKAHSIPLSTSWTKRSIEEKKFKQKFRNVLFYFFIICSSSLTLSLIYVIRLYISLSFILSKSPISSFNMPRRLDTSNALFSLIFLIGLIPSHVFCLKYSLMIILTTSGTVAIFLTFLSSSSAFSISSVMATVIFGVFAFSFDVLFTSIIWHKKAY